MRVPGGRQCLDASVEGHREPASALYDMIPLQWNFRSRNLQEEDSVGGLAKPMDIQIPSALSHSSDTLFETSKRRASL